MSSPTAINLLFDLLLYCMIAITIAMPLYHFVRESSPELSWNYHGNVPTSHLGPLDILGVSVALLIPMSSVLLLKFASPQFMETATKASSEGSSVFTIISNIINQLVFASIVVLFIVFRTNILEAFGLKRANWAKIAATVGVGMVAIYSSVLLISFIVTPLLHQINEGLEPQVAVQMIFDAKKNNPSLLIALAIMACVVAPICEEILFRGYLYSVLKRYSCRLFAAIISGLIFGIIHASLTSIAPLAVIGILLAVIYEFSGSLWAPIICHSIFNTVNILAMIFFVNAADLPY